MIYLLKQGDIHCFLFDTKMKYLKYFLWMDLSVIGRKYICSGNTLNKWDIYYQVYKTHKSKHSFIQPESSYKRLHSCNF